MLALLLGPILRAQAAGPPGPVVVGSKLDTEGAVLGNLFAMALRRAGIAVRTRLMLGPTSIVRHALLAGAIDLYPEYTGDGAVFFHREGDPAWHDPAQAYALDKALDAQNGLVWLPPAPAENGWGIAVPAALARQGVRSLADLASRARSGRVRLAASVEFVESADALPAFERAYGFHLTQDQLLMLAGGDTSATMRAAAEGASGVNAAMAYGTDGALEALDLVLLGDPLRAGLVFQPCPVVRAPVLAARPDLAGVLAPVMASLTGPVLRRLNARVVALGEDAAMVAADHLRAIGL